MDDTQKPIGDQRFHGSPVQPFFIDELNTVTRFFPKPVTLTLPDHTQRKFPAGIQEIPAQLADNDWLLKNGMKEFNRGQPLAAMVQQAPPGSHAHGLTAIMSGGVYDATMVPDARVTDAVLENALQFAKMTQENVKVAQDNLERAVEVYNAAKANYDEALARRGARDRLDPENLEDPSDRLTPSQRKAITKDKIQNESKLGLDKLSDEDRAKFDAMPPREKAKFLAASPEDRVVILADK